jgi:hypothetical protein
MEIWALDPDKSEFKVIPLTTSGITETKLFTTLSFGILICKQWNNKN